MPFIRNFSTYLSTSLGLLRMGLHRLVSCSIETIPVVRSHQHVHACPGGIKMHNCDNTRGQQRHSLITS